jgi:hypothetical protein
MSVVEDDIAKLTEGFTGREWVFEKIDHWLKDSNERFFILTGEPGVGKSTILSQFIQNRREKNDIVAYHFCQAANPEDMKPGRILRSLMVQLGKTLPHYGLALVNTIKPVHLRAEVSIQIETSTDSKIAEVYIENLKESDPENELDILLRAPIAALPKIYAERQKPVPEQAIFLIDALDLAVSIQDASEDEVDIVTLLSKLSVDESLPSWIRFILTSRPDRRVMREFEPLQPCLLKEMSEENLSDIRQYIQKRIAEPVFRSQLEAVQMSSQILVDKLTDLSIGNFRYTRCLLYDLEVGKLSLNRLPTIPESLASAYAKDLSKWFSVNELAQRCKTILKVLATNQEPLAEERLVSLTGFRPRLIRQDLWGLRQFLDVGWNEEGEEKHETFAIFHPSLRDYLLNLE